MPNAFALTERMVASIYPGRCPGLMGVSLSGYYLADDNNCLPITEITPTLRRWSLCGRLGLRMGRTVRLACASTLADVFPTRDAAGLLYRRSSLLKSFVCKLYAYNGLQH